MPTELREHLQALDAEFSMPPGALLASLVHAHLDQLPLPAQGHTRQRWATLAAVAAHDLSLAKLFEGHTDALAILAELGAPPAPGRIWGTWCAESPTARLRCAAPDAAGRVVVNGTKAWCSGASSVTHALVSAWNEQDEPCLLAVELNQPGIAITAQGWRAIGMGATASVDVIFDHVDGALVGAPNAYVSRPGFWHGGAGIASCWHGAASAIAAITWTHVRAKGERADPHQLAHLGHIDIALTSAQAVLHEVARWMDQNPSLDARQQALRARLAAEACAVEVMRHAGRALGAGPLCKDVHLSKLMADLPVFLRQSHAERDLAELGQILVQSEGPPWSW